MAYFKDFNFVVESGAAGYREGKSARAAALPPQQGLRLTLPAVAGLMDITVSGLDFRKPRTTKVVGGKPPSHDPNDPDSGIIEIYNHVPLLVELFAPGQDRPAATLRTEAKPTEIEESTLQHRVGGAGSPAGDWELRVTNIGKTAAIVNADVGFFFDRQPIQTTNLPLLLLDHTYDLLLEALLPSVSISGNIIDITFGADLIQFFGNAAPAALGTHRITLPSFLEGSGKLQHVDLEACSGKQPLAAMLGRWQEVQSAVDAAVVKAQTLSEPLRSAELNVLRQKRAENDAFRARFEAGVKPDFATIHATAAFSTLHLELDLDRIDLGPLNPFKPDGITIGEIREALVEIYLAFQPTMDGAAALVLAPLKVSGAVAKTAEFLGIIPAAQTFVEQNLPGPIESASAFGARFLAEALGRLSAGKAVFMRLTADDANWNVQHTAIPAEHAPGPAPNPPPPPSVPGEFIVHQPETLARLDQIQTIVVVMMENRSFDHMLGYLRQSRGPKYDGLRGGESNPVASRTEPVQVRHASEIVPDPITQIRNSPDHSFLHVRDQINGGEMSGFAQDFENRFFDSAETAMTFYTGAELKTYDHLAAFYKVCNHWFASHPGPTWPNRWTTLGGSALEINNPDIDDPRLGFITAPTIFDLLDAHGIDWRVFESDLSLIRTYDRYRLNTDKVVPFRNRRHPDQGFLELARDGKLPPVVFVEPNFSDFPPLSTANDDLAPVDLRRGQLFIRDVYTALRQKVSKWRQTLLLVTYDEHGGFFDHVPPPGTRLGPPEFLGPPPKFLSKVPKIHPDGADHMGVRVPALLASPMVSAGEVSDVVFDHTSIIKTILLRHRARFSANELTMFGARVNQAAHLGQALDLDYPRGDEPGPLERTSMRPGQPSAIGAAAPAAPHAVARDDFHESLRRAFLPRRT